MISGTMDLTTAFFLQPAAVVARQLLGIGLARRIDGRWLGGWIVETEAYLSRGDRASHSHRGRTRGNASMFGPAGHWYVYPIHQQHCLNVVTGPVGEGSAVLIRAIEPLWGVEEIGRRRGTPIWRRWTSGPGMLCDALGVDRRQDGAPILANPGWRLSAARRLDDDAVTITPRIGIRHDADLPLRFFVDGNRFVSGRASDHRQPRRSALGGVSAGDG